MKISSVDRVRAALAEAGQDSEILQFPEGTRSAADAAAAVGCEVSHIAKSVVFRCGEKPVLVLASGANRVDEAKVARLLGAEVTAADGRWVREVTGFAIGGVAPVGHRLPTQTFVDEDLMVLSPVWAAAGSPMHVFRIEPQELVAISGARIADVRKE